MKDDSNAADRIVDDVARELVARRASGELAPLPTGELERQFDGVVDVVEAGLDDLAPVDTEPLTELAHVDGATQRPGRNRLMRAAALRFQHLVESQVRPFSERAAATLVELASRQHRLEAFIARVHLDRIRSLEYRIALLEQELERLRAGTDTP